MLPMIRRVLTLAAVGLALVASHAHAAADTYVTKASAHSVSATLDRLSKVLKSKGITIFARVNHGAGAEKVGVDLPETELLIFGNPKLGSPLMMSQRTIGLDLPMKALAWADADGKVYLTYLAPKALAERHGITDREKIVTTMTGALDAMTTAATKAE